MESNVPSAEYLRLDENELEVDFINRDERKVIHDSAQKILSQD